MKLGIIGMPGSGKMTVFEALTRKISETGNKSEDRIAAVTVPDDRVDVLSDMYRPEKTIYAQVSCYLPGKTGSENKNRDIWTAVRDCDALIHVVRNYSGYGMDPASPGADCTALDQELVLADQVVVEKRLERLELDKRRGKTVSGEEKNLLEFCLAHLETEKPLRENSELANAPVLRGFAFVSGKPMLILLNNDDEDEDIPRDFQAQRQTDSMVIRGKLERELAQMTDEEAGEFLSEFNITDLAVDRVIRRSYELLGLISFFTVGDDEVRAWTIAKNTAALDAAGAIHTDLKKGFIRAEVISYDDLMDAGSHAEAKKRGTVRLEGKTYVVLDGDIMNIRFNV